MEPVRGSLAQVSLPSLLRPLVQEACTGVVRFTRGEIVKTVYLSQGRLIFATSTDADDRLGETLVRKGLISYRALEDSVGGIDTGRRQGTFLVETGAIESRDLVAGVTEQVREIIYSLFDWDTGDFEFQEGALPSKEVIVIRMSTEDILMEGVRRVRRWSQIRAGIGGLQQSYVLAPASPGIIAAMSLQKDEINLIGSFDGIMTVEQVCAALRLPDFTVCRALWGLWAVGVLNRIPQDAADPRLASRDKTDPFAEILPGASVSREIDRFNELHRLLFELVCYELKDGSNILFEQAFIAVNEEHPALFGGVAVDGKGQLDADALRQNVVEKNLTAFVPALHRLIEVELSLVKAMLGPRKASIIQDGVDTLRSRHTEGLPR